jgi:diguanylate cyclase (GGDEF)-like protein/PAS domain S-box-containing protein
MFQQMSGVSITSGPDLSAPRETRVARYRHAVGQWPHVVFVVDENGVFLDVSSDITERLGYDPDFLVGQSAFAFLHESNHHLMASELIAEIQNPRRNSPVVVAKARHANGNWHDVEFIGFNRFADPEINGLVVAMRELSERNVSDRVLAAGDYLFTATATVASDATTIFDATGRRVYASPSMERLLGYNQTELMNIEPLCLVHPDDVAEWQQSTQAALQSANGSSRVECRLLRKDGSPIWIEATVVNLLEQPTVQGIVVHTRDIEERRKLEAELRRRASEDPLTGLGNRSALNEHLATFNEVNKPCTVLFCDLDGFKNVNDQFGHAAGDALLVDVATKISSCVESGDFAARVGGDEFCIVSDRFDSASDAHQLAERVRDSIATVRTPSSNEINVSIGVLWSAEPETPSDRLSRADRAMYEAKRQGRNRIELSRI